MLKKTKVISPADFADVADLFQRFQHKNLRYLRNQREMKCNSVATERLFEFFFKDFNLKICGICEISGK